MDGVTECCIIEGATPLLLTFLMNSILVQPRKDGIHLSRGQVRPENQGYLTIASRGDSLSHPRVQ
jgi:hypothetical protein